VQGWGVIMAKASAGALYPTLLFLVLSMSRWLLTFLRRFYVLSRYINSDLHQAFHIYISIAALALASLHAIGHLTGTFLYGSRPAQQDDLAILLGPSAVPRSYHDYIRSLPGWTGLTSFGLFWLIALMSMPVVRRKSYEIFQLAHLLMFPLFGFLAAHGTAKLLQAPMLGYWLVAPVLLVIAERSLRVIRGFRPVPARIKRLDDDTVALTCQKPGGDWRFEAGQYVFVQVPVLSRWQWHPFTISACVKDRLQVHIKTSDGDWTGRLQELAKKLEKEQGVCKEGHEIKVGVDGPFGAPAQRFYDFDRW
jgi:predicted ferric reductase